ncbi:efflux transporter outer membrane subunit [Novosphingobium sp. M1R2S20]|uniref:Efflux transporter outer membrane subunit n=1 Tax=Novosphingobium rhizovicinum TaxID=3228928 RepID=A0ABV3REA3_9SPHN
MRKAAILACMVLGGCNLAPAFDRPPPPIAPAYPKTSPPEGQAVALASELSWQAFFRDARLQELVQTALERNRDLAQAYARIEQARAQYRIQAADRLPTVDANTSGTRARQPLSALGASGAALPEGAPDGVTFNQFSANVGVSAFELDLWGRVRNLSEAQRQRWLASVEGARAFRLSLIAQVAAAYFDIRAGEERIRLAERSLEGRREGVRIANLRLDAGVTSTVDYDQSVLLLTQAETELAQIQLQTEQSRNLLDVLTGGPVTEPLPPPASLSAQLVPIAPGLPSDLLTRRPDVLEAEYNLRAANADIGAARAAFFPSISLTGLFGFASNSLDALFNSGNRSWSFGGAGALPIFDWGRREGQLEVNRARAEELAAAYQRTVQGAFREVADALVARQRLAEQIESQTRTLEAQRRLARTAGLRYENGIAIYLEVLDAERNLFAAEQALIQLRATELQNAVTLYTALGGGLEPPVSPAE